MRRIILSVLLVVPVVVFPALTASAQDVERQIQIATMFASLSERIEPDAFGFLAITQDGESIALTEGHDPLPSSTIIVDTTTARPWIDDSGDGADPALDITAGFGNVLHVSDATVDRINASIAGLTPAAGFWTPHDGSIPALAPDSVVIGVETAEAVTDEEDPTEIRVNLRYQLSVTFTRDGVPVSETDDVNGNHNASIDLYQSDGFGTDAYEFPGGQFQNRATEFLGRTVGNTMSLFGPWDELDGANQFTANIVDWPNWDGVDLGDLDDFGIISVYLLSEMDADGNGVLDPLETAVATDDTRAEGPAADPGTEGEGAEEPTQQDPQQATEEEPSDDGSTEADSEQPEGTSSSGGGVGIIIALIVAALGGGLGLWYLLSRNKARDCEEEAAAVANATLAVDGQQEAVDKATDALDRAKAHLDYTENNASEQRELRLVEAQQVVSRAESDLAREQRRLDEARDRQAAAQHAYDVCTGAVVPAAEPDGPAPPPPVASPPSTGLEPTETPAPVDGVDADVGPPGTVDGGAQDDGSGGGTAPPPPPPPPPTKKPECENGQTREVEERIGSFTIPVDSLVRFAIVTDDGPVDDLEDLTSGTPIADMIAGQIAELVTPDSISVSVESLTPGAAHSWQAGLEAMATAARTEVEVVMSYDLEDVSVACVRLEKCVNEAWVTVGRRVDETSRTRRTVSVSRETVHEGRPLGATFTTLRRGLMAAANSKAELDAFVSSCR